MEKEIRITNELDEITALAIFVEEFCSDLSLPTETTMHINLALEEAVSNVIMYAGCRNDRMRFFRWSERRYEGCSEAGKHKRF